MVSRFWKRLAALAIWLLIAALGVAVLGLVVFAGWVVFSERGGADAPVPAPAPA